MFDDLRFRRWFRLRHRDVHDEVDAELRFHFDMRVAEMMERGIAEHQARELALDRFGDVERVRLECYGIGHQRVRQMHNTERFQELIQDLRFSMRSLFARRGFSLAVIVATALGIGATTAIFSVVDAVLLRPLPFREPSALVRIWEVNRTDPGNRMAVSPPTFSDITQSVKSLTGIAALTEGHLVLTGRGEPEQLSTANVTSTLADVLGVRPQLGRFLLADENRSGGPQVVVISHQLWLERFGGDVNAIGQSLTLDGTPHTVVGVMPPGFDYPRHIQAWLALAPEIGDMSQERGAKMLHVVARIRPNASIASVQRELDHLGSIIAPSDPLAKNFAMRVQSMEAERIGDVRPKLMALFGAAVFVLIIACANVAGLLLARSAARQHEVAIRTALGATRRRLTRQFLTEYLVLACVGGLLGVMLAVALVPVLVRLSPVELPGASAIAPNLTVIAFAAVMTLLAGFAFALAPALSSTRGDASLLMLSGTRHAGNRKLAVVRQFLVAGELALSLILLVGASLLLRSFAGLVHRDPGFDPTSVTMVRVSLPSSKYATSAEYRQTFEAIVSAIAKHPLVHAAGASNNPPVSGNTMTSPIAIENAPQGSSNDMRGQVAQISAITPGYLEAIGSHVISGRTFTWSDRDVSTPVAMVSASFARRHFPDGRVLGKRVRSMFGKPEWREIVGIVADVRHEGLQQDAPQQLYVPYLQQPTRSLSIAIRSDAPTATVTTMARGEIRKVDHDQPIDRVASLESLLSASVAQPRFYLIMVALFSVLASMLSVIGVYSVTAYAVVQRTREIGIRMALGATRSGILRHVLREAVMMVSIGLAIGAIGALAMTGVIASLLHDVAPRDGTSFVLSIGALAMVGLAAAVIPAAGASRLDPGSVLKHD